MGLVSAICEMIMQDFTAGVISLLPALPLSLQGMYLMIIYISYWSFVI